ncbi:heme exporter protein CcmD [Marinomonas sp. THO17]|uniref:heme exporter protein CcmD n=1 Tax=Marinomonas sp. THO17 TaxID=3149048 RepID=UPI00336BDDC2
MAFDTLSDFLAMGKHGLYVWSAYAIGCGSLLIFILTSICQRRNARIALKKRYQKEE